MHTPEKIEETHLAGRSPKLLDQVRDRLRVKHYSIRTEHTYMDWIKRFIWFHDKRHSPATLELCGATHWPALT